MSTGNKLVSLAAAFALITAPLAQAAAEGQTKSHHRHSLGKTDRCPVHRTAEGELVDCQGWRLRSGGWDNSCFNLDYLPSQFACSSRGRGR